jgi:hypothetical protein
MLMPKILITFLVAAVLAPAALAVEPSVQPTGQQTKNAATWCKAERTKDPAAFAAAYGTNANKKNAFGKCVSAKARQLHKKAETAATANRAATCKDLQQADAKAFAAKYKNLGQCVAAQASGSTS